VGGACGGRGRRRGWGGRGRGCRGEGRVDRPALTTPPPTLGGGGRRQPLPTAGAVGQRTADAAGRAVAVAAADVAARGAPGCAVDQPRGRQEPIVVSRQRHRGRRGGAPQCLAAAFDLAGSPLPCTFFIPPPTGSGGGRACELVGQRGACVCTLCCVPLCTPTLRQPWAVSRRNSGGVSTRLGAVASRRLSWEPPRQGEPTCPCARATGASAALASGLDGCAARPLPSECATGGCARTSRRGEALVMTVRRRAVALRDVATVAAWPRPCSAARRRGVTAALPTEGAHPETGGRRRSV